MDIPHFDLNSFDVPKTGVNLVARCKGDPKEVMELVNFDIPTAQEISSNDVIIELLAAPMNHADFFRVKGVYGRKLPIYPLDGGHEGTFKVIGLGKEVKKFKLGDLVLTNDYGLGTWRSHIICNEKYLQKLPVTIDIISSSMIRVNLSTVYRMLQDFVQLEKGDIIVQNGANGHVGQSFIQIAKSMKLKSINIIKKSTNPSTIEALHTIGADAIIEVEESEKFDFTKHKGQLEQHEWYDPVKVKLGLNGVGGVFFQVVDGLVSDGAYIITYGGMQKPYIEPKIGSLIFRDIKYAGFSIGAWLPENKSSGKFDEMNKSIINLIKSGNYYRPPFLCYPLSQHKEAISEFFTRKTSSVLPKRMFFTWKTSFAQNMITLCKRIPK